MKELKLELRRLNAENRILNAQNKRQAKEVLELRDKLYKMCDERNKLRN